MTPEELEIKKARQREACRRYKERHPERRKEQYRISNKKRYAKYREKYLEAAKLYRKLHGDEICKKDRQRRNENIDLYRARARQYYRKNRETSYRYQRTKESRYKIGRTWAIRRGLEWNIPESDYFQLIRERCHYRNHPIGVSSGVGLDRIDNSKGYIIGNVVPCCGNCNRIKCHLLTYQEMVAVGKLLDEMSIAKATEGVF